MMDGVARGEHAGTLCTAVVRSECDVVSWKWAMDVEARMTRLSSVVCHIGLVRGTLVVSTGNAVTSGVCFVTCGVVHEFVE